MNPQEIIITPELASKWMQFNTGNRNLPLSNAKHYAELIRKGEFITTHQALAFTGDINNPGRLLDGQTRLTAVIATGIPIKQWVFWNAPEITFRAIDGGKTRSFVDHNPEYDKKTIAVLNVFWWLYKNSPTRITKTDADKLRIAFGGQLKMLTEKCSTAEKKFSSSVVKAAFCFTMYQHPDHAQDIANVYRNMVLKKIENLPVSVNRLFVKLLTVSGGGFDGLRIQFPMVHKAVTPSNWSLQKLYGPDDDYYKSLSSLIKSAARL